MNEPSQLIEDLRRVGVVDRIAVRAVLVFQSQKLCLRQLALDASAARCLTVRPLYWLMHPRPALYSLLSLDSARRPRRRTAVPRSSSHPASSSVASLEILERDVGQIGVAAMLEQGSLGQHQVGAPRQTEVGASIANQDVELAAAGPRQSCICSCPTARRNRSLRAGTSDASDRRRATADDWRNRERRCRCDPARF